MEKFLAWYRRVVVVVDIRKPGHLLTGSSPSTSRSYLRGAVSTALAANAARFMPAAVI